MRRFLGRFFISLALIIGFFTSIDPASADTLTTCVGAIGATSACPAQSPQELTYLYNGSANGTYWLNANGTSSATYFIMDTSTSYGGGNLFLIMKGSKTSTNFAYNSSIFSNSNSLNDTFTTYATNDVSSDYKSYGYNNRNLAKAIAVFKDPTNGTIPTDGDLGTSNSFGGETWQETSTLLSGTLYDAFNSATASQNKINGDTFSTIRTTLFKTTGGAAIFSYESGNARYGFNNSVCIGVRWGIVFNNESDFNSCDAGVGIGLSSLNGTGDYPTWNNASVTIPAGTSGGVGLQKTGFQVWGNLIAPSMNAPTGLSASTTSSGATKLTWTAPSGTPTAYVIQCKPSTQATWDSVTSTNYILTSSLANPIATISGLSSGTTYNFRVFARSATDSSPTAATLTATAGTVNASSLSNPYTGSAQYAAASTTPGGLTLTYTYKGIGSTVYNETNTAPTLIGTYVETATITDATSYIGYIVVNLTITNAITTATLNVSATLNKLLSTNLTATTNTSGLVTYYANGRTINKCVNISSSATCAWKPMTQGVIYLSLKLVPTDSTFPNLTTSPSLVVVKKRAVSR